MRFHRIRLCNLSFHHRKGPCLYRWNLRTQACCSHREAHLCSAEASPSSPWSAYHSSSQPTSNHTSASPGQRQGQGGIGWLAGPDRERFGDLDFQKNPLTAAVHWMTSLQESDPDFSLNSSPELLSSQSFASWDFASSSSWQITPARRI